ncbi:3'-5' exonuclease [Ramlibacter sp. AN1133]|uniref:3'-5' exonuclease n=1 Tax=Ramlibacter sp. AN1133 TaxID=3133429 RepID=UPI0030BBE52A
MAIFPQGKTKVIDRTRGGEKRLLEALARTLEDDYTVWHNIPIMGSGREPDVVILHPSRGLLVLEVKDWKRRTILDANPMRVLIETERGRVSTLHPVAQARSYMLELTHQLQKYPELLQPEGRHRGQLLLPWGWGAVLNGIRRKEVEGDAGFAGVFEPHKVLLWDDLAEDVDPMALQEKLWGMFNVRWQHQLSLPQMNIVRGLLFPELRIGSQQVLPLADSPSRLVVQDVLQVMDLHQEMVARTLGEGHRVIHGPAGSGKTMILVFRAVQLAAAARPDKPILVLCYNRDLATRLETMLRLKGVGPEVQVATFHAWAMDLIRTYQLGPIASGRLTGEDYDALARLACEGITAARVPKGQYTALLIDEAHDLADEWLAAAVQMVDPATKSLLVLYDDAQSIYHRKGRKTSFAKLGIEAQGRTKILRINYRNTTEVLALAVECAQGVLDAAKPLAAEDMPLVMPQSAGRSGPLPTFLCFDSGREEASGIAQQVRELLAQGRHPAEVAVLARYRACLDGVRAALASEGVPCTPPKGERGRRQESGGEVMLTTFHSSKGLEFPCVFLVGLDRIDAAEANRVEELRLLYVAMTRATHSLVLAAVGSSRLTRQVEQALERVKAAWH